MRRSRIAGMIVAAIAGALLAIGIFTSTARAQSPAVVEMVYLRGADTLGMEKLSVTSTSWSGELTKQGQPRLVWTQNVSGSTMGNYMLDVFAPGSAADAKPMQQATFTRVGDSVRVDMRSGANTDKQVIGFKQGAFVMFNQSLSNVMMIGTTAVAQGKSSFDVVLVQGGESLSGTVRRSGDSLIVNLQGVEMRGRLDAKGLPLEIDVPSQGLRVVRVAATPSSAPTSWTSPGGAIAPKVNTVNYDAPANAPYTAEHVRIPTDRGYELAATYTRPTLNRQVAVAITISGSGGQDRDSRISIVPGYAPFREIADTLGRRGIATLRFDDRAVGGSGGHETMTSATSVDFADDVRSIVAWLRKRPDVDTSKIMLIGHSEGGLIAPMVAATDTAIHAIALLAGSAYDGKRILLYQNEQALSAMNASQRTRDSVIATIPARLDSLGSTNNWIGFFLRHDPVMVIRQVKQPVLIVQGETDRQVTHEQADTLAAALHKAGNHNVTLKKFPNTNHLFVTDPVGSPAGYAKLADLKVRREVLGAIADWAVAQTAK